MELRLRRPFPLSTQLIGVDGGATEVKAHEVLVVQDERGIRLRLGERSASVAHARVPGFATPAERGVVSPSEAGQTSPAEREQGWGWVEATAACILRLAREREAKSLLVGIAMPGRKTPDGRGIFFALNGPRIPHFLDDLERRLIGEPVVLAASFFPLLSDGLCCGLGEQYGELGLLRSVANAYYVGGGTGVAEALKLGGRLIETDDSAEYFPRAWQMRDEHGTSYDQLVSVAGLNRDYAARIGAAQTSFPEEHLDDPKAHAAFTLLGYRLATFLALRLERLANQSQNLPVQEPGPIQLERVVIGQRLGQLLGDARTRPWFQTSLCAEFERRVKESESLQQLYVGRTSWSELDLTFQIVASRLRAAPAIGAAASALIAWDRRHG